MDRLWWDPNGMCREGSRMDWHPCTQAVLKEKAGWEEIFGLKWWQKKKNCKLLKLTLSAIREMEREFEKNEACYSVFHTEWQGSGILLATAKVHSILQTLGKLWLPLSRKSGYSTSEASVIARNRLLEVSLKQDPVNYVVTGDHPPPWEPCSLCVLLSLSVITSSRPSPIGPWLYFLGLESFWNGFLSWFFWGHSQATFRYYFKSQRFSTVKVCSIIGRPVRDVSRTQMNAGDSSEFYIHCIFFYTNILIIKFNLRTVQ